MKMLIKSNIGTNCIPPLVNTVNHQNLDDVVYEDYNKCDFSINILAYEENVLLPGFDPKTSSIIDNIEVKTQDIVEILKILDPYKAVGSDKIGHKS